MALEHHVTSHPIDQEILKARRIPSVRAIVIPPCPESLRRLQDILAQSELDAGALDQLASSDVAMAAALIRQANSPLHGLVQPVQTVGMALTVLKRSSPRQAKSWCSQMACATSPGRCQVRATMAPTTAWSVRWLAFSVWVKVRSLRARASVTVLA